MAIDTSSGNAFTGQFSVSGTTVSAVTILWSVSVSSDNFFNGDVRTYVVAASIVDSTNMYIIGNSASVLRNYLDSCTNDFVNIYTSSDTFGWLYKTDPSLDTCLLEKA